MADRVEATAHDRADRGGQVRGSYRRSDDRDPQPSQAGLATLRTIATTSGALLALAIIAMTIGLIRGESASDLRTLTATGAASRTRRTLTASTAGALALLGVVLGAAGAYVALVAGYHSELDRLVPLPLGDLALLAVGLAGARDGRGLVPCRPRAPDFLAPSARLSDRGSRKRSLAQRAVRSMVHPKTQAGSASAIRHLRSASRVFWDY